MLITGPQRGKTLRLVADLWKKCSNVLSDWRSRQQRALLWHASYLGFPVSHLGTHTHTQMYTNTFDWHTAPSANSCPAQRGNIICLNKCVHVGIPDGSRAFRAVRRSDAPITSPRAKKNKSHGGRMRRAVVLREGSGDGDRFLAPRSHWSGNSVRGCDLIRLRCTAPLPVFPSRPPRKDGEILLWFRTPSSLGQNRPHE